ncbi:MAG TPA: 2-oxoacid:acceptor oxidoreductase subunit alpha [Myxococcales bacterium LLY-WYZ-16_1]|nr:2-oxoacid:acceptor oxidoreductase subunit alpha [Myxococcales bacterium LLY-WYZ-16_1]
MTTTDSMVRLPSKRPANVVDDVVIRFSGDSGDGMQLTGTQFTHTAATIGNDISTFPDYPAEIRAPAGTTFGVSGFQIHFASHNIFTPGDQPDVLVAMNPAALKVNLPDLKTGGILIANRDAFTKANLHKAGYEEDPLENGSLESYRVFSIDITTQVERTQEGSQLSFKEIGRTKNFWTLGLLYYLYDRPLEHTLGFIEKKFSGSPEVAEGNRRALKAGYLYGYNSELFQGTYEVASTRREPGLYRNITGNQAIAWGAIAASEKSGLPLFYGSYPITPASDILHELSRHKDFGVKTVQAEDEIAAVASSIGASFSGQLAMTGSSGPGIALKTEALGLAVATELPLVVVNVQRGGPSTGLPTKTEQSDLMQALFGRNGECPMPVLAPHSPPDCFTIMLEAFRIALRYMTPVLVLSDGYIANGSEPWRIPDEDELPDVTPRFTTEPDGFHPFRRDPETLSRPWAIPGTTGLEHRIGGLERSFDTGHISYDPENHHKMVETRQAKVDGIARELAPTEVDGPEEGELAVVGWGSTYGALKQAVHVLREQGHAVAHVHPRYLNPLPADLGPILRRYRRVLVPELNLGQLRTLIRARFLIDAEGLNKVQGKPFKVNEIVDAVLRRLG